MNSRRSFLQMLAGGAALALAPVVRFIPSLEPTVYHLRGYATFADIVTATINNYPDAIAANILQHNALYQMLSKGELSVDHDAWDDSGTYEFKPGDEIEVTYTQ